MPPDTQTADTLDQPLDVDAVLARLRGNPSPTPPSVPAVSPSQSAVPPAAPPTATSAGTGSSPVSPDYQRIVGTESDGQQFGKDGQPLESYKFQGDPDAPTGASQARPSTAALFVPNFDANRFRTDKDYNIQVGQAVYNGLLKQYGGDKVLANAAYNAGTGRVDSWVKEFGDPRSGDISNEEFASKIPFPETRAYLYSTGAVTKEYSVPSSKMSMPYDIKKVFDDLKATQFGAQTEASAELVALRKSLDKISETPPKPQQTSPFEGWGIAAMALAALGGALTHTPLTTALQSMAGVMNGLQQGDQQATKNAMERWKAANDAVLKTSELRAKMYETAMRQYKDAPQQATAELQANAAALNDQAMMQALNKGDVQTAMAIASGGYAAAVRMKQETFKFQQYVQDRQTAQSLITDLQTARASGDPTQIQSAQQALADFQATRAPAGASVNIETQKPAAAQEQDVAAISSDRITTAEAKKGSPLTDAEKAQIREQVRSEAKNPPISDAAAEFIAGRVLAGDERATVGMARSNVNMTKVSDAMVKLAKEQNVSPAELAIHIAEFQGAVAGERALGVRTTNMEVPANEVKAMAPIALTASERVDRTEYPTLNSILIAAARGTGDENVVRFAQATNALIYSYSKFLSPTGIPTDSDKARATDILSTAWTQGQFRAAIDQIINQEIPTGRKAIQDTRQEFRGGLGTSVDPEPKKTGEAAKPPASDKDLWVITSKDKNLQLKGYKALPPGSHYRWDTDPPGTFRTKQ